MHEPPKRYLILLRPRKVFPNANMVETLGLKSKRPTPAMKKKLNPTAAFLVKNPEHLRALVWLAYKARYKKGPGRFTIHTKFPDQWDWNRSKKKQVLDRLAEHKLIKILLADSSGTRVKLLRGKVQVLFNTEVSDLRCGFFNIEVGDAFHWALNHKYPYALHLVITMAWRSREEPETGAWYAYIDRRKGETHPGLTEHKCRSGLEDLKKRGLIRKELPGRPDASLAKANYWLVGAKVEGEVSTLFRDDWFLPEEDPPTPPNPVAKKVTPTDMNRDAPCTESVTQMDPGLSTENITDYTCHLPELIPESGQVHPRNRQSAAPTSKQVLKHGVDSKKEEKTPPFPRSEEGEFSIFFSTRPDSWFADEELFKKAARILVDSLSFTRFLDRDVRDILINIHKSRFSSIADDPGKLLRKRDVRSLAKEEARWAACFPVEDKEQLLTDYPAVLTTAIEHMQSNDWFFPSKVVDFCHKGFAVRHAKKVRDTLSQLDQAVLKLIKYEPTYSGTEDELSVEQHLSNIIELDAPDHGMVLDVLMAICRAGRLTELQDILPDVKAKIQVGSSTDEKMLRDWIGKCNLSGALLERIKRLKIVYQVYEAMWSSGFSLAADSPDFCSAVEIPAGYFTPITDILSFIQTGADVPDWAEGPPLKGVIKKVRELADTDQKPFGWLYGAFDGDCPILDELVERLRESEKTNIRSVSTYMLEAIPVLPDSNVTEVVRAHSQFVEKLLEQTFNMSNPNPVFFGAEKYAMLLRTEAARTLYDQLHLNTFSYPSELPRSCQMKELMELYENDSGEKFMERLPRVLAGNSACIVGNFVGALEVLGTSGNPKLKDLLGRLFEYFERKGDFSQIQKVRTLFERVVAHPEQYKRFLRLMPEVRKECRAQRYLDWDMLSEYPWLAVPKNSPTADVIALEREMSESQTE